MLELTFIEWQVSAGGELNVALSVHLAAQVGKIHSEAACMTLRCVSKSFLFSCLRSKRGFSSLC